MSARWPWQGLLLVSHEEGSTEGCSGRALPHSQSPPIRQKLRSMLVARDDLNDIDRIGCTSYTRRGALRARRRGRRKWWHLHRAWLEAIVTVQHALDLRVGCFDVRLISGLSGLQ